MESATRAPSSSTPPSQTPLVTLTARRLGPLCPFGNDVVSFAVHRGGCVWIRGHSGRGKTTLALTVAGVAPLSPSQLIRSLHMKIDGCEWDPAVPKAERCGVLFQQTTLLDELTVAGNLAVALQSTNATKASESRQSLPNDHYYSRIKQLLTMVGLDYERDASKRPTELSGGMARRAGLALQLAQQKQVIVLDEPFTGLDYDTAVSVAKELVHLRRTCRVGFVLISHEPELATLVLTSPTDAGDRVTDENCCIVELTDPMTRPTVEQNASSLHKRPTTPSLFGTKWRDRFLERLVDYIGFSLPLILLTFAATGTAIAMLSADSLRRMDVTEPVLSIVDKEVRPMIKLLTNEEPSAFTMMGVRFKVKQMLNQTVPPAKATLYAMGMAKLFVLEIGPLLTALLLCGRIGGSYAGRVAVLQSTAQSKLLYTLGISSWHWSWTPSLTAALIAGPVVTSVGTTVALVLAGWIGPAYGIGTPEDYWTHVRSNILPPLRLKGWTQSDGDTGVYHGTPYQWDYYRTTHSPFWIDTWIEILTYPVIYHVMKAVVFLFIIMVVAEFCGRSQPNLTNRGVPSVITTSVVMSGLCVILADWAFSRLWLQRR